MKCSQHFTTYCKMANDDGGFSFIMFVDMGFFYEI